MARWVAHQLADPEIQVHTPARQRIYSDKNGILVVSIGANPTFKVELVPME